MSNVVEKKNQKDSHMEEKNYITTDYTLKSWFITKDHKRIAMLYLVTVLIFFFVGSVAAGFVRFELTSPNGQFLESETYNRMFTAHGVVMIFFFLLVAIPAVLGNFLLPLMIGARDLAFPKLNLLSYYLFLGGALFGVTALVTGGVDTGWTFYTPLSSMYSNSQVVLTLTGAFIAGFSSISTAVNFIVTIHKMRAPGLTWFRLPLFVWAHYATSVIILLGTPVVAITLALVAVERLLHIGVFSPEYGGDPVLFQHMFWFYSHPAVYIMILPAMGVINEVIACFSRNRIFGYKFIAASSLAIAALGFLVWGHHMFVSSESYYQAAFFSLMSFLVAIPSAIKVFNWSATLYKGMIYVTTPMAYAIGFLGLFVIGGLTGLYCSCLATDEHLTGTYFIVAHFHYVMVGGTIMAFLAGIHFWWPKMTGRLYPESWGKIGMLIIFSGFHMTFMPQFIVGFLGMPRRYHYYYFAPEFQIYHVLSTAGAGVLAIGFMIPVVYLILSLKHGAKAPQNPWNAKGLEWEKVDAVPTTHNFHEIPVVNEPAYNYSIDDEPPIEAEKTRLGVVRESN